ncbi:DUF4381 domain-containing protein [Thiopseudomonas denitrificans]|uniref:Uncharacterized protein DUF4381 n=1 Tax=Thiopseudomonas denitrificans TaxID=1501432 RepID=A0A4R6TXZ2_9GAMM|nr:DUF4381 domain-containing protein [Thiopseudomonas denitrificans]TDQ36889.1 uncharacterized protein DUF4381 [Thiopseudomonas denitrificans]
MPPALESMHPLIYPTTTLQQASTLPAYAWLLAALPVITLLLFRLQRRRRQAITAPPAAEPASQLGEALSQLQQLSRPAPDEQAGPWLQQLNLLLKRFCAVRYPDVASHRLSGREWLAFLDSRCPAAGLTRWMILVQGSYLPDCRLSETDVAALHHSVTVWMRAHV